MITAQRDDSRQTNQGSELYLLTDLAVQNSYTGRNLRPRLAITTKRALVMSETLVVILQSYNLLQAVKISLDMWGALSAAIKTLWRQSYQRRAVFFEVFNTSGTLLTATEFSRNTFEVKCAFWAQKYNKTFTSETYIKGHTIFSTFIENEILLLVIYNYKRSTNYAHRWGIK
jgi:hypothetical protein